MRDKDTFDKQNAYNRDKYDRIGLMLPKGQKEIVKDFATAHDMSINELFITAVNEYMSNCANCAKTEAKANTKNRPKCLMAKGFFISFQFVCQNMEIAHNQLMMCRKTHTLASKIIIKIPYSIKGFP